MKKGDGTARTVKGRVGKMWMGVGRTTAWKE